MSSAMKELKNDSRDSSEAVDNTSSVGETSGEKRNVGSDNETEASRDAATTGDDAEALSGETLKDLSGDESVALKEEHKQGGNDFKDNSDAVFMGDKIDDHAMKTYRELSREDSVALMNKNAEGEGGDDADQINDTKFIGNEANPPAVGTLKYLPGEESVASKKAKAAGGNDAEQSYALRVYVKRPVSVNIPSKGELMVIIDWLECLTCQKVDLHLT